MAVVDLDKKHTRQKILLGAFLIDLLENNKVNGLCEYTANNLDNFLDRKGYKELMSEIIDNLKKCKNKKTIYQIMYKHDLIDCFSIIIPEFLDILLSYFVLDRSL